jgi:Regulator of chromosome condensation (RCC1) repeat
MTVEGGEHMKLFASKHPSITRSSTSLAVVAIVTLGLMNAVSSVSFATTTRAQAWGQGADGELGNGATASSDVPVSVSGLRDVSQIAAGGGFGLVLLKDGLVLAWGDNSSGELGNGTTTNSDVPVSVAGLNGVKAIAAGPEDAMALLKQRQGYGVGRQHVRRTGRWNHERPPVLRSPLTFL